ncbi:hypothetical protein W97_00898 [Coniosporium apollinis CBS 100218]|uniref:Prokaryotic-type class I peptide chain release factors domain-containing protein n=1 Tax=Coniosporium apollinis (strain CBS 100218) TaxID=1168221 RepID=R7YIE7_CONA1|nr:uncharacterized protein W97_00898 [Coniosporium apollinis CBS 100218]EON61682.1 hypothetical protein W97_00898 [Coniosporium apollinis CBS 100218]
MLSRALHRISHLPPPLHTPVLPTCLLLHRTLHTTPHPSQRPLPPRLTILESDILESFLKGSGPGGQKINKTASAVQLKHLPTGIVVKCQHTRSRSQNRKMARRLLAERVEELELGEESRGAIKRREAGRKKRAAGKKKRRKYRKLEEERREVEGAEVEGAVLGGGVIAAAEHGAMTGEEEGGGRLPGRKRRGEEAAGRGDVDRARHGLRLVNDQDEDEDEEEGEEDDEDDEEDEDEEDEDEDDDDEDDDDHEGFDLASPGHLFEIASPAPSVRKFVDNPQDPQYMALITPSTGRQEILVKETVYGRNRKGTTGWVKPDHELSLKLFPFDTDAPPLNIDYTPDD